MPLNKIFTYFFLYLSKFRSAKLKVWTLFKLRNVSYLLGHTVLKILYSFVYFFYTFTNRVDPDEMQHYAAFHLGLHCLQKYSFKGFVITKG